MGDDGVVRKIVTPNRGTGRPPRNVGTSHKDKRQIKNKGDHEEPSYDTA